MEIDITRIIILGVMVVSAFSLGFMAGKAYLRRKMRLREEEEEALVRVRKALEALVDLLPKHLGGKGNPTFARYAPDKGEPQMEVCDIEETKEDDETRDGRDGFGIGEGHEGPPE